LLDITISLACLKPHSPNVEEGIRKKESGRGNQEEGIRKREEGIRKKESGHILNSIIPLA